MTYTIKCLTGIHSKDDFTIKGGQELEVTKEIYDYFNNTYGASGRFSFKTTGATKKATRIVEPRVEAPKVETRVTPKKSKTKKED